MLYLSFSYFIFKLLLLFMNQFLGFVSIEEYTNEVTLLYFRAVKSLGKGGKKRKVEILFFHVIRIEGRKFRRVKYKKFRTNRSVCYMKMDGRYDAVQS
jgi:hypothetical protein